jgi:UDP-galactopyranose mutase
LGRLATYKYINSDEAVSLALEEFERLRARWQSLGMKKGA